MEKAPEKSAAIRSMEERWKNLPAMLTEIKKSKSHTIQTLADGSGVSADRLGKFLRGKLDSIRVDELEAVCIFLGVSLDALLGNTNGVSADERVRELEIELRSLTERLGAAEKAEKKDEFMAQQFTKGIKMRNTVIAVLLIFFAPVLLYYMGVDIANPHIGMVRDAYTAPLFFLVLAVIIGGIAMGIALVTGLIRDGKKNDAEEKMGGEVV